MKDVTDSDASGQLLADRALVARAQEGERWAMDELLRRHTPAMRRLAGRMLSGGPDAEDVLQEAFVRAFQAIPSFKGNSAFSTWLYRIVVNACLMYRRKRTPLFVPMDGAPADAVLAGEAAAHLTPVTPLDVLLAAEQRAILREAVEALPESLRVPFVLTEIDDVAIADGARTLNLGVGAYRTRLYRARNRIRTALEAKSRSEEALPLAS